ncbi:MAG: VWA domain-containing protein [Thiothrix sp.]|nr:VWA domain-containing protein [Thiothrix sp.]HPQ94511.1 VWA domain-containing protein [Thiolinea sp.]
MQRLSLTLTLALCLMANPLPAQDSNSPASGNTSSSATRPSVMIVLDGSNSMWGQLEGINKIVTARESLKALLANSGDKINFGLLTYGDKRKKNGCTDFTLVSRPENYDMVDMLKNIYKLNPRGRSPISAALETAASGLPRQNAHILLVSDGEESCGGDPCAMAAKLVADNPDLRIDVIGFRAEKEAQLECIAENGQGAFVVADNHERLNTLLAGVEARGLPENDPATNTPARSDSGPDKMPPGSLELNILADGARVPLRANYSIYNQSNQNIVNFTSRTQVHEYLKPGTYKVKAIWKNYHQTETVTIQPGQTSQLQFDAGSLGNIQLAVLDRRGQPLNVNLSVYTAGGDFISQDVLQNQLQTQLPVGRYRVKANLEKLEQEAVLDVSHGNTSTHTFRFENR